MTATAYRFVSTTEASTADDCDLIAVERAINNSAPLPRLTPAEQHLAASLMHKDEVPLAEICARIGVTDKTVTGWLNPGPRPRRQPQGCPSRAAYRRHRARGENCDACRAANAEADKRYRLTGSTAA